MTGLRHEQPSLYPRVPGVTKFLVAIPLLLAACAPAVGRSDSAPLATNQTWLVTVQRTDTASPLSATVKVTQIQNPNPGIYANTDFFGMIAALSGGEPAVQLNRNENRLRFTWNSNDVAYTCRISAPDAAAKAFSGDLIVQDEVKGTCSATLQP